MRKFVKWMNEKGYMNEEEYEHSVSLVNETEDELPNVEELSSLIYDYIQNNPLKTLPKLLKDISGQQGSNLVNCGLMIIWDPEKG